MKDSFSVGVPPVLIHFSMAFSMKYTIQRAWESPMAIGVSPNLSRLRLKGLFQGVLRGVKGEGIVLPGIQTSPMNRTRPPDGEQRSDKTCGLVVDLEILLFKCSTLLWPVFCVLEDGLLYSEEHIGYVVINKFYVHNSFHIRSQKLIHNYEPMFCNNW